MGNVFKKLRGTTSPAFKIGPPALAPTLNYVDTHTLSLTEDGGTNRGMFDSNIKRYVRAVVASYVATIYDDFITTNGAAVTVTLTTAVGRTGERITIKNLNAAGAIVDGNGSETIDGALTVTLAQGVICDLISDGANWMDAQHAVPLYNNVATANGTITTTQTTPTLATGMTLTPAAGTYLCIFTGCGYIGTPGAGYYLESSISYGGTQVPASINSISDAVNYYTPFTSVAIVTVNGSQAIEGRWRRSSASAGTATMYGQRTLTIVKIG